MLRARASVCVVAAALSAACGVSGPTESMTGAWATREDKVSPTHLNLQQDGDTITGTACYYATGFLRFRLAPAGGTYPYVTYVITDTTVCNGPNCAEIIGHSWSGRLDTSGEIVSTRNDSLRFMRVANTPAPCLAPR